MTSNAIPGPWPRVLQWLYYATAVFFFVYLFAYYWTSEGGPVLLAFTLVPVTYILFVLEALRTNGLYPKLPLVANYAVGGLYIVLSVIVAVYMHTEYYDIGTVRAGVWNAADITIGVIMVALVMEYSRLRHVALFVLNILLILYAVYGSFVPGMARSCLECSSTRVCRGSVSRPL
jgi:TRAP-type uncharacterized transport system fused permease subunit